MPLAKGSKSKVSYKEETVFNEAPAAGAYNGLSFSSESLVENINKITSDEIRSDRAVPNIRGGNIATGGSVSADFGPNKNGLFLKHLMGTVLNMNTPLVANTTAYVVGTFVRQGSRIYKVTVAGTTSGGVSLTSVDGLPEVDGTATFVFEMYAEHNSQSGLAVAANTTAYLRGQYVLSFAGAALGLWAYLVVVPGTTSGAVSLTNTSGQEVDGSATFEPIAQISTPQVAATTAYVVGDIVRDDDTGVRYYRCSVAGTTSGAPDLITTDGSPETEGTATFIWIGTISSAAVHATAAAIQHHRFVPSDLPAVGLCFEKQILGQGTPLVVAFPGCRIGSLGINIPQEGIVRADWSVLGMRSVDNGATPFSTSVATVSDTPFIGGEAYVSFKKGAVNYPGRPVREGNFTINNTIDENIYTIGSRFRRDLVEGRCECNGSLTTYFENRDEYDFFKNEDDIRSEFSFNRQGQLMNVVLPHSKLTGSGTPQISGGGVMTAQYNIDAFKSGTDHYLQIDVYTMSATLS